MNSSSTITTPPNVPLLSVHDLAVEFNTDEPTARATRDLLKELV